MNIPAIKGIIRRRILLNYRVSPEVVQRILPSNFQPKVFNGYAIAGICLIRLEEVRPQGLPAFVGLSSENSAHRIAVEWEGAEGQSQEGVFVPRRDTDSLLNSLAGGRIFPGVHHHSDFSIHDSDGRISLRVKSSGMNSRLVEIEAEESECFPESSVFESLEESSRFFEAGCIGYSSRPDSCILDGLLLKVPEWRVISLEVKRVHSSFFDDQSIFPIGQIEFDHALLMRDIQHEWHSEPAMTMGLNSTQNRAR
jgi:hypothetical protein